MSGKMFLEKIHSEGLAHISYILGQGGDAAVIDPRRDCEIYVDMAHARGANITHIFETHRNEDYLIGSRDLASRTGAQIYHWGAEHFRYGNPADEGETFELGKLKLTILSTPGHTYDSISIAVADTNFSREPVAVFTGDALFIGDVGRTDFFPDRAEEVAGLLYDSIFEKILPLGDQVILYPAHGAGSVCGAGMAEREFSTLGYERRHNPLLQKNRDAFIRHKVGEHHYKPPYFEKMHRENGEGSAPILGTLTKPRPLNPDQFERVMKEGALVLDARSTEAVAGALIPGSIAIALDMLPAFAGFLLPYGKPIELVVDDYDDVEKAVRYLLRIGYDEVIGFLAGGITAWEKSARPYDTIPAVHVNELVRRIQEEEDFTLLDVRTIDEVKQGRLPRSRHVYVGEIQQHLDEIPRARPVVAFCGSGQRSMIAASLLKANGYNRVEDCLGSMAACRAAGCPIAGPQGE